MQLSNYFGRTGYLGYGWGPVVDSKHTTANMDGIPFVRLFNSSAEYGEVGEPVKFAPNYKNRNADEWLKEAKAKGAKVMWCAQGGLIGQNISGNRDKYMPIEDGADPMDPESWADYAELCRQIAIRYSADATGERANVFKHPSNDYFTTPDMAGADLIDSLQIGNEVNFPAEWQGGSHTITPEDYAVCFYVCYKAIREESKELKIVAGSILSASVEWLERFMVQFKLTWKALEPGEMPTDFYLSWHWYMREKNQSQSTEDDRGASPEYVKAYDFAKGIDDMVRSWGLLGHYCTESGWSDFAEADKKQAAPVQVGYSIQKSVALLCIRATLMWSTLPAFKGVSWWHCADGYDGSPYWGCGFAYKRTDPTSNEWNRPHPIAGVVPDFTPKPQDRILKGFIEAADMETVGYSIDSSGTTAIHRVTESSGKVFMWADNATAVVDGNAVDPMPRLFDEGGTVGPPEPAPKYPLEVQITTPDGACFLVPARVKPEKA